MSGRMLRCGLALGLVCVVVPVAGAVARAPGDRGAAARARALVAR